MPDPVGEMPACRCAYCHSWALTPIGLAGEAASQATSQPHTLVHDEVVLKQLDGSTYSLICTEIY